MRYTVDLTPEPDGSAYNVTVPTMPGCLTWGATVEDAPASAREAIALHLEGYAERGEPYPVEDAPPRIAQVEVEPLRAASSWPCCRSLFGATGRPLSRRY